MELVVNPKINLSDLVEFYQKGGWTEEEDLDELRTGLKKSYVIAAYDGDEMVGFIRAISDYVTTAFIQDLMVLPQYSNSHIGEKLVQHVLRYFDSMKHVGVIVPHYSDKTDKFFRYLGFKKASDLGFMAYVTGY